MLTAVWRRDARATSPTDEPRWAAFLDPTDAEGAGGSSTQLLARKPGGIVRQDQALLAYPVLGRSRESRPGQPAARWEGETLTITAGSLPQSPLYYVLAPDGSSLVACSALAPLAALYPDAPVDARRLLSLMAYGVDTDTNATPFGGIRRLRPGETLVAGRDEARVTREFPRVAVTYRHGSARDLARELRARLDAAVARAIGTAERVAVFASGGLDSSGILALAAARARERPGSRLDPIAIQYAGPGDDRPYLDELTAALGVAPARLRPEGAAPWFLRSLCIDAQPGNLASTCLLLMASAAARDLGSEVVLTGVSGDSVNGGTLPFVRLTELARRGRWMAAVNRALRLRIPWPMSPLLRLRYVFSPLLPESLRRAKRRLTGPTERHPAWLTPRSRALLARARAEGAATLEPPPDSPDAWMRHLCVHGQIADTADAVGQLASVTGCYPVDVYLDAEFVRFMLELDPLLLSHGHEFRGLYRLAMKGLLPERLRARQDKGDFGPAVAAAAVAANAFDALRDLASLDALASAGLVDAAALRPALDASFATLRRGERDAPLSADEHLQEVWQILSAEAFLRQHGQGRGLA